MIPASTANAQVLQPTEIVPWIKRHALVAYFALAFAGTWILFIPVLLSARGLGVLNLPDALVLVLFVAATYVSPFLSAFVVTGATEGKAGLRALMRRMGEWRVGLKWYLVVLAGYPLLFILPAAARLGAGAVKAGPQDALPLLVGYLLSIPVGFFLPTLGEETGWRGFALPRLERAYGPIAATLVLGALHALWHFPAYFIKGSISQNGVFDPTVFVANSLGIMGFTFVFTWLFNNTKGSVLFATLVHATLNSTSNLIPQVFTIATNDPWFSLEVSVVVVFVLVVLTRGRLSYGRLQEE